MARERKGTLVWRASGWCALVTVTIDGEPVRKWYPLETDNKAAAKRKLARLVAKLAAGDVPAPAEAAKAELFADACERIMKQRIADGVVSAGDALARLKRFAVPTFGPLEVTKVQTAHVNETLDACKAAGKSRQTIAHLKQEISTVFATLEREGAITLNPVDKATLPTMATTTTKERAVLTDAELAVYLGYEHPQEHWRMAVLETQTMSCIGRMFGGVRTGDLHALKWEGLDSEEGAFTWGWAPRRKTKKPQLLEIPSLLRPILRDWWERHGQPKSGLVFPARRGKRAGEAKIRVSHARAFRRDLKRAFGLERWETERGSVRTKDGKSKALPPRYVTAREMTSRERELFEGGEYVLPVDFHSWRRAYSQSLADADVNAQQATALAGHATLAAHARYLASSGKIRKMPEAALPKIGLRMLTPQKSQPVTIAAEGISETWEFTAGRTGLEPAASGVTGAQPSPPEPFSAGSSPPPISVDEHKRAETSELLLFAATIRSPWFPLVLELAPLAAMLPPGALDVLL